MAQTNIPDDLMYTKDHEWVRVEDGAAVVGITDFAQKALGEVTYVELPEVGAALERGAEFAVVESLKAASDVYAPVGGTVAAVNEALGDEPRRINADPYGGGWLCRVEGVNSAELDGLLSPAQYAQLLDKDEA